MLAVRLLSRPQFMPGYAYGLDLPVCVVSIGFASNILSTMESIEGLINEQLELPSLTMAFSDNHFAMSATKIASWCLELQEDCGLLLNKNYKILRTIESKTGGARVDLLLPYRFEVPSLTALKLTLKLINSNAVGKINQGEIGQLIHASKVVIKRFAEVGQNIPDLLKVAIKKNIPFCRIQGKTYRFGFGAAQQILESTFTSNTPVVGVLLSRNKLTAAQLLNKSGFPGGSPLIVTSPDSAVQAASSLGYPVVVKPIDTDGGAGVSALLQTPEDVTHAYQLAREKSPHIMVDRHIEGTGHRFTVMFNKVVKVTAKAPWGVQGDGISTVSELVALEQTKQAPTDTPYAASRSNLVLDHEAMSLLRQYQLTPESVLPKDYFIPLRRRNNANAGGSTVLLDFDQVHKDNLDLALRVTNLFMLDVAGIDLIIPDVSRSWIKQNCLICDVNSQPQVGPEAAATFLESVMCGKVRITVTLILFAGENPPTKLQPLHDVLTKLNVDGVSSAEGTWIKGKQIGRPGSNGFSAATSILLQRDVFHAAVIMSVNDVLSNGLPCDRIQHIVIVQANTSSHVNPHLKLHIAGNALRDAIESDLLQSGLMSAGEKASSFTDIIWPHFIYDL